MTDRKKNLFVGAAVLAGLSLLGWMLLQFGNIAILPFTGGRYTVIVITDRADGISGGSNVSYRGMSVGQVQQIHLSDDMSRVVVTLQLNAESRVPGNVEAVFRSALFGSGGGVSLELLEPTPKGRLAAGGELPGRVSPLELIPKEIGELAADLRKTSQQFRESGLIRHLDEAVVNISAQSNKAGEVMESVQKVIGDQKFRDNLQSSMTNIKEATTKANQIADNLQIFSKDLQRAGGGIDRLTSEATDTVRDVRATVKKADASVDQLTKQISDRLLQVSTLLDSINVISKKVEQGKGTAGLMVNDSRLYEAMVDSAKQLNTTVSDLSRLVQQWEQEGISFKLK